MDHRAKFCSRVLCYSPSHATREMAVQELLNKFREMSQQFCCAAMDALFLCLWAAVNVGAGKIIRLLSPVGIDAEILLCMQILFGISTLIPISVWIYKDLRIMVHRAQSEIRASQRAELSDMSETIIREFRDEV